LKHESSEGAINGLNYLTKQLCEVKKTSKKEFVAKKNDKCIFFSPKQKN
jgi:hypothetical protein